MGCVSSKILTKSLSFREDLRHRSKRNRIANGIPMPDELFTSSNGTSGDHKFLGLVSTTSKPQTGSSNSSPKSALEPTHVEMINTWELMAGLEEQVEQKQEVETKGPMSLPAKELVSSKIADVDKIRRSKSCHWSLENEGPMIDLAFEGLNKDHFDWGNKGVGRSRSFHTAEEYDAMLERIQLSKAHNDDDVQLEPCGVSTKNYHYTQNNVIDVEDPAQLLSRDKYLVEDNAMAFTSGPDIKEMFPSNYNTIEESSSFKDVVVQERSICDTGLKRTAMAKGLESLQIPSAVELKSIGSLREWLHGGGGGGGCVESPGDHVTPKFGKYNKSWPEFGEERKEESIFDPELLAAFEEFIQQLEIEEERILEKMEGNQDEITGKDISAEENKEHLLDDRNRPQFIF